MSDFLKDPKRAYVIDFETEPIQPRPAYPPKPVGVGILHEGKSEYVVGMAAMKKKLAKIWESTSPLLFHNANFDLEVARVHLGLPLPECTRVHDTLPMLFLRNPYAESYSLKPSAERILKMKPEEKDKVVEWLIKHQPMQPGGGNKVPVNPDYAKKYEKAPWFEKGLRITDAKRGKSAASAYICLAPESLVGKYCIGDVVRTYKLAMAVGEYIEKMEMVNPYRREIELIYVILDMEREGVRVDTESLRKDERRYTRIVKKVDNWLRERLRSPKLNVDSGKDLAHAICEASFASEADLGTTPTGQVCTAKTALDDAISDEQLKAVLRYRGAVTTCLTTFIRPWLEMSAATGRIFARWNAIRQSHEGGISGARTGRLSSSPNLMNIPKQFSALFSCHEPDPKRRKTLPESPIPGLPDVPRVRRYVLPDDGHILIDRDFSQQELRVLAHFEDDVLAKAYVDDPDVDLHQKAADILHVGRTAGKTLNLAIIYGMGLGLLAEKLGCSADEAKRIKSNYFAVFPSIKLLLRGITQASRQGNPVNTWGERKYYVEAPKLIRGRLVSYEYKLVNYLIQGSAADLTKQCMIDVARELPYARLRASVHDELLLSVPKARAIEAMRAVKEIMGRKRLDVPMTSTGKLGPNWADMKECE